MATTYSGSNVSPVNPPMAAATPSAAIAAGLRERVAGTALFDWAGGLVWLALGREAAVEDGGAALVREAVAAAGGGHATLIRAPGELRARVPVFQPQPAALARLPERVKDSFDPKRILNPGRMYAGM
jgi:glycolate oxidase FAD binding subunit